MTLIKIVKVLVALFFVFIIWLIHDLPDYTGGGSYGGFGFVEIKLGFC